MLAEILTNIKIKENIKITKKAQEFILNICNNSIRLLVNYMEKFNLLDEKITLEKAKHICTNISYYEFEKFTKEWHVNKNLGKSLKIINSIFDKGYSVMDICFILYTKMKLNWFFLLMISLKVYNFLIISVGI